MPENYLTAEDVAERLQCSARHVRRLIGDGRLRSVRVGRLVRVAPADLEAYLAAQATGGTA